MERERDGKRKDGICTYIVYTGKTLLLDFFLELHNLFGEVEGMCASNAQAREQRFEDGFSFHHVCHGSQTQVIKQVSWQGSLQPEPSLQLKFFCVFVCFAFKYRIEKRLNLCEILESACSPLLPPTEIWVKHAFVCSFVCLISQTMGFSVPRVSVHIDRKPQAFSGRPCIPSPFSTGTGPSGCSSKPQGRMKLLESSESADGMMWE